MKIFLSVVSLLSICDTVALGQSTQQNINIVFIGNSITQGVQLKDRTEAPPATTAAWLLQHKKIRAVEFSNQGHSGYTTLDFLPGTGTAFANAEEAAKAFTDQYALLIFSIKLGTNDSAVQGPHGAPVSADNYIKNLKIIADRLLADFPQSIIVFQHPLWYSPNTYNGSKYLQEGLSRLQSYIPKIDSLVAAYADTNPRHVFTGDKKAFNYFKKNYATDLVPEKGQQGIFYLHPNKKGALMLGSFWGRAIEKCVKQLN